MRNSESKGVQTQSSIMTEYDSLYDGEAEPLYPFRDDWVGKFRLNPGEFRLNP